MTDISGKKHSKDRGGEQSITSSFDRVSRLVESNLSYRFTDYAGSLLLHRGKSLLASRLVGSPGLDIKAAAAVLGKRYMDTAAELKVGADSLHFDTHHFSLSCSEQVTLEIRTAVPRGESVSFAQEMMHSISGDVVAVANTLAQGKGNASANRVAKGEGTRINRAVGKGNKSSIPPSDRQTSLYLNYSIDGRKIQTEGMGSVQSALKRSAQGLVDGGNAGVARGGPLLKMSHRGEPPSVGSQSTVAATGLVERKQEMMPARLLLRQTKLIGRSADMGTLIHSLIGSVREILDSNIPCLCWRVRSDHSFVDLDFEDPPETDDDSTSMRRISEDSLFAGAVATEGYVFVEGHADSTGRSDRRKETVDSRLLIALGPGDTASHLLEFRLARGTTLSDSQLYTLELLASHSRSRAEILSSARSLEVEKRVAWLLADHLNRMDPGGEPGDMLVKICGSIVLKFPELEGVACLRREGDAYRLVAGRYRDNAEIQIGATADAKLISELLASDSGVAGFIRDSAEWKQFAHSYGNPASDASACTMISCKGSSEEFILILLHKEHSPIWPFAYAMRTLFTGLASIDRALLESSRKGGLMVMTDRLLDRLEAFSFNDGPRELVSGFAETYLSIAGADMMRYYNYDDSEALFLPLFDKSPHGQQLVQRLTLHDFNVLSALTDREGDFVVPVSKARKHLWKSLVIDEGVRSAYAIVTMEGKKPVSLLVIGFNNVRELDGIEEYLLLRVSRTLSNLLSSSRTLHDIVERSHFSSEFLRILSQSMMFREGGWSFEVEQIANRMCSLIGSTLQKEFVFLFSSNGDGSGRELVGKWSRHPHDEKSVSSEAYKLIDLPEGEQQSDLHGRTRTLSVDGRRFEALRDRGVTSATVMHTGNDDGPLPVTLLLLDVSQKQLAKSEKQAVSTALEETRLMLESRLRRSVIDWTLNAMRSELRIARNLSSTFDMGAVLDGTVREVANFLGTEICLVELINDRGGSGLASITDPTGRKLMDMPAGENTPPGQLDERRKGFSTLVMETGGNLSLLGEGACMEAIALLPSRDRSIVEFASGSKSIKSLFGAPLSFAGKLLGLLVCMRTSSSAPFGKNETSYLESVAALASTAIENSRNVESTINALSKLRKLDTLRSNFSSIAAHELRTPLTSIRVYIELMKLGKVGSFTDQEKKNIESLLASISELTDIINNMLEFTRMEAMLLETEMSSVSLRPVMEETCALLSPAANAKSIKLELEVDKEIKNVSANAALIKRVINNLIGNALKFTSEGGRITVKLKNDREGLLIVVEDTGKGIPLEDLPYIFDRFHVVDSSILHSRTGFRLGLPISKLIVERHGGRIWADSEVGKGSKFYVLLPVSHGVSTEEWLSEATGYIH